MRIIKHPVDGQFWWYFCPTVIAARVRAIVSPDPHDRLPAIWVRPLNKRETEQVNQLIGVA